MKNSVKDVFKRWLNIDKIEDKVEDHENRLNELENFASKYKIKSHRFEKDIKNLLEQKSLTIEELDQILEPLKNKIMAITDYEDAIDFILDHIDKKNPSMNVQKPIYHGPVIDEETEEDKYNKRIEELKLISREYTHKSNAPSMEQLKWVCDIEFHLNVPKFKGTTQKEVQMFIGRYKEENKQWWKNNSNKGVAYGYGK
jgi:hypothetical protein